MRSAPTLKIWVTPFASVAMLEKLALLKIALWRAPASSSASLLRTSVMTSTVPAARRSAFWGDRSGGFMGLKGGSLVREILRRRGKCLSIAIFRRTNRDNAADGLSEAGL